MYMNIGGCQLLDVVIGLTSVTRELAYEWNIPLAPHVNIMIEIMSYPG